MILSAVFSVELPSADGFLEAWSGSRHGEYHRDEASGTDAPHSTVHRVSSQRGTSPPKLPMEVFPVKGTFSQRYRYVLVLGR